MYSSDLMLYGSSRCGGSTNVTTAKLNELKQLENDDLNFGCI